MGKKSFGSRKRRYCRSLCPKDFFSKVLSHSDFSRFRRFYLKIFYDLFPAKALLLTLEIKHPDTYKHCKAVASLSADIYREYVLKYGSKIKAKDVKAAALFHDIGKMFISERVLKKKHLSKFEWEEIREHPEEGAELTEGLLKSKVVEAIAEHQEEIDGSGYPLGLDDDDLNLVTKIISVADDFCAMTEKRGYNVIKTPEEAVQEIIKEGGKRYDKRVVEAFERVLKKRNMIKSQF